MHFDSLKRTFVLTLLAAFVLAGPVTMAQADDDDFVPRSGAPPASRTGGASRGVSADAAATVVTILAPIDTVGFTTREQPIVYWHLSADTDKPIEIAINNPKELENPVAELTVKGPTKAGMHKLDLSKLKQKDGKPVKLSPGIKYDMVVEVAASSSAASANPTASAKLMRLEEKEAPADAKSEKDKVKLATIYGKKGIWFDFIDALNGAIEAKPKDESLAQRREKALAAQKIELKTAKAQG